MTTSLSSVTAKKPEHAHLLTGFLRRSLAPVCLLSAVTGLSGAAHAATRTWSGATANWNIASNWIEGVVPVAGDDLVFPAAATTKVMTNDTTAATRFNSLRFQSTGYSLATGNTIALGTGIDDDANAVTPNNNVVVDAGVTDAAIRVVIAGGVNTALFKGGPGTLLLSAVNLYTGGTTVNAGVLSLGAGGVTGTIRGALTINAGTTVRLTIADAIGYSTVNSVSTVTINGGTLDNSVNGNQGFFTSFVLNGGSITSTGGGSFNISTAAGKTISSIANANSSTISSPIAIRGATGNTAIPLSITAADGAAATDLSISGVITNGQDSTSGITKFGAGTLRLTGINTYTGGTIVNDSGTLVLASPQSALSGTIRGTLTINSGASVSLAVADALGYATGTNVTTININGGTLNNAVNSNNGFITNFVLSGGAMTSTGGGAFNFDNGFGISSNASATTSLVSAPIVIRSGTMPFTVAQGTTASGVDLSLTGIISGANALRKFGSGTLQLSGVSTYSGPTTISAGTLLVNNTTGSGTGTSAVTIASGATLGGTGTIVGAVSVASGATHSPGDAGPGIETTGNYLNNGVLSLDIAGPTAGSAGYDQVNVTGTVNFAGAITVTLPNTYTPTVGDKFTVINNDGSDAITPTSSSIAEGGLLNSLDGRATFSLSYSGGDGNDLVLTTTSARASVLISQFRLSGPSGASDEFIELVNTTNASLSLTGLTVQADDVALIGLDLTGKIIPAGGHLLITNSTGYSLDGTSGGVAVPNGAGGTATGDAIYTGDIASSAVIALKSGATTTLDSVNTLGTLTNGTSSAQYAFVRRGESGVPQDSGDDVSDFNLVSTSITQSTTDGSGVGPLNGARLGAPGPRNTSSPIRRNAVAPLSIPSGITNAAARYTSGSTNFNSAASSLSSGGQYSIRRTLTNNTGAPITRLRFRLVAGTLGSSTSSGLADLRAISSKSSPMTVPGTGSGSTVNGLFLEAPSVFTSGGNGGGMNSSWATADLTATPLRLTDGTTSTTGLPTGASANLEFLFAVNNTQGGSYRFFIDVELLP